MFTKYSSFYAWPGYFFKSDVAFVYARYNLLCTSVPYIFQAETDTWFGGHPGIKKIVARATRRIPYSNQASFNTVIN